MKRIKKGDAVKVIAGNSKGMQGEVLRVEGNRILVKGVNVITRATKPSNAYPDGGLVKREAPIDISNVMLIDKKTGSITRVGFKSVDGKKVRFAKKSGNPID